MSRETLSITSRAEIVDRIRECGIVGAGGAGFPTHVKFGLDCSTVIVNGAECEPLLESDKYLLLHEAEKILDALEMLVTISGAERGVVALKRKSVHIVSRLKEAAALRDKLEVFELENYYPAGDEHCLVKEITGTSVPPAGLPLDVGCIVQNVETMRNVYEAVWNNRPVIGRLLTCAGEVPRPSIVEARLGISFQEVIDACGGALLDDYVVLVGGPMMGSIETDFDSPVTKLTSGLIVLPPEHKLVATINQPLNWVIKKSKTACCQCIYCTELCPRYLLGHNLEPHKIMRQINLGLDIPEEVIKGALLCSECGVCEVVACTMDLSPRLMSRIIKQCFREAGYRGDFSDQDAFSRDMWEYRKIPTSRVINRLELSKYDVHPERFIADLSSNRVELLLRQHIGASSRAVVSAGDVVKCGDLLTEIPAGALGARLHASIDGEVIFVDEERIILEQR